MKKTALIVLAGAIAWGAAQAAEQSGPKAAAQAVPQPQAQAPAAPAESPVQAFTGTVTTVDLTPGKEWFSVAGPQGAQERIFILPGTALNKTVGRTSTPVPGDLKDLKQGLPVRVGIVTRGNQKTAQRISYKISQAQPAA